MSMCFLKQRTAYDMRISDWSSDVCSSDLDRGADAGAAGERRDHGRVARVACRDGGAAGDRRQRSAAGDGAAGRRGCDEAGSARRLEERGVGIEWVWTSRLRVWPNIDKNTGSDNLVSGDGE